MTLQKQTGSTLVSYQVRADDPDFDAYQVYLEQGVGLAFNYGGLVPYLIGLLGTALGEIDPGDYQQRVQQLQAQARSDPKAFDESVRSLYHLFYPKIRFYSEPYLTANTQQVPESGGANTTLETI